MKRITTILWTALFLLTFWEAVAGQTTLYSDDFSGEDNKGKIGTNPVDISGVDWTIDISGGEFTSSSDIFGVQSGVFEAINVDGDVIWESESFSISGSNNLEFSFDAGAEGDFEAGSDIFEVDIIIDNGTPQTLFSGTVDEDAIDDPMFFGSTKLSNTLQNFTAGITGSGTNAIIRITVNNNAGSEIYKFDNLSVVDSPIKPEPSNHVTAFSASSNSISGIDLSWTDATGTTLPENYLILINKSGTFTPPADGTPQSDDTDLSDGNGTLNVAQGVESAAVTKLESNTQYYFEIYPYTNLGSNIDYKTDGTIPTATATTLEKPDLVLNEILADPANDQSGDANNDGIRDADEDEFLEFVNTGSSDLDISGWTILVGNDTKHTFLSDPSTILGPNQAIVVFGGGNPAGVFGGSIIQTSGSLGLTNTGETITVMNGSDTLIEVTYSGASDQSETRDPDLTGNFEDHTTADTDDNSEFSPGTKIDGSPFQSSETLSLTIEGSEGWRMISSPTFGNSYQDLLGDIWTQCSENADYNGTGCDEPNVLIYDGSSFVSVGDLNDAENNSMISGQGFIVYVYSDDDFNQTSADNGFPKNLELTGVPRTGYVEAEINPGNSSFTLTGNPYKEPIDWDLLNTSDLDGTVYVYDYSYGTIDGGGDDVAEDENNVGGGYRTWNGNAGSLSNGVIAPFQGFWVQSSVSNPTLTFVESAQTTGGTFYSKEDEQQIIIHLRSEMNNMYSEAFFTFTESGFVYKDKFDALKLTPLDLRNYLSLASETEGTLLDINNLPSDLSEPIKIPIHVNAYQAVEEGWNSISGEVTLSWPEMQNIPSSWSIKLIDQNNGKTVNLIEEDSYRFNLEGSAAKIAGKKPFNPFSGNPIQMEKASGQNRFVLSVDPYSGDDQLSNDIPDQFVLEQNYPNPFNPSTNIKYQIAEQTLVELGVYNIMGQRISTLVNEIQAPGSYEVTWSASDMASGIYYYRLNAGGVEFTRQMTLIK